MACGPLENSIVDYTQREFLLSGDCHKQGGLKWYVCIGPAAMACVMCKYVRKCTVNAEKCDLLTP